MITKLSTKWTTIATVSYNGSVSRDQNRNAHGGVCHLQACQTRTGLKGRKVNSNGRFKEVGEVFNLDLDTLAHWEKLAIR